MWEIINELQRRIEEMSTRLAMLQSQLTESNQSLMKVWQDQGGGGGGGATVAYWCKSDSSSPFAGASGAWPTITPTTDTLDVYVDASGTLVLISAGATVRWFFKDACAADKLVGVVPNGDGSYDAIVEACTVNS